MPPSKYLPRLAVPPGCCALLHQRRPHSQLAVYVKSLVGLDLHLAYAFARRYALLDGRLEVVAPGTPPAVAIAVVVAAQEVALRRRAALHRQGDVDGFEELLLQRGVELDDVVDVLLDILGVQPPQKVAGTC
jgi:hypothetical protein